MVESHGASLVRDTHSRDPAERRVRSLLTGRGRFVGDIPRRDHLEAVVVRSPVANGRLTSVRVDAAHSLLGVHAVLTAQDLGDIPTLPIRAVTTPGLEARRQPVIASDAVRYVGQPVAVVVADNRYIAEDAADLVHVDIERLPPITQAGTEQPQLFDPPLDNCFFEISVESGAGEPRSEQLGPWTFLLPRQTAVPLETRGLLVEQLEDELHIWGLTKYLRTVQRSIADFFDLQVENVVCHHVDIGGMFGVRGELYPEEFLIPWVARTVRRPVLWVEDRREHFLSTNHSRQQVHEFAVHLGEDGRLEHFTDDMILDMGAFSGGIGTRLAGLTVESLPGPYRWNGYHVRCRAMATNKTPVGVMRGPGTSEATFVRERALDIAARAAAVNPIDLRLRNLLEADEIPFRVELGPGLADIVYDSGDYSRVAHAFFEQIGLENIREEISTRKRRGEHAGIGTAFWVAHSGAGLEESVEISLSAGGSFEIGTTANEVGQGLTSMVTKIASERLGIPAEQIEVVSGDTRAHGGGNGTYGSRTTIFVGSAISDAAARLTERARAQLAETWGVPIASIEQTPTGFRCGRDRVEWKELAPLRAEGHHRMESPTYGFGIHLARVSVDDMTAATTVEKLWVGYDCGRVISATGAHDQIVGACVQALGAALLEQLHFDLNGQPQSTTLLDYLLPTAHEAPPVEVHLFETAPAPGNPLGAKGIGEAGMYGVAAAVMNAAADAVDLRGYGLATLPLTGDALAPLLKDGHGRG